MLSHWGFLLFIATAIFLQSKYIAAGHILEGNGTFHKNSLLSAEDMQEGLPRASASVVQKTPEKSNKSGQTSESSEKPAEKHKKVRNI